MDKFDVCIVGAGAVGLAIAYKLSTSPAMQGRSIVVLERESGFGQHSSSRNSEVIHAGIFYPQDSLKAKFCVRGKILLYDYCAAHNIPVRRIGKYIVATPHCSSLNSRPSRHDDNEPQDQQLHQLEANAKANGVDDLQWISNERLMTEEPAVSASAALYSPSTGIFDSHVYMQSLLHMAQANGIHYAPFTTVIGVERGLDEFTVACTIQSRQAIEKYRFQSAVFINSGGLYAQSLAASIAGLDKTHIPELFLSKGDYFSFIGRSPFSHLIYPVPERHAGGLGIHATLDLVGQLRFGPDAELTDRIDYTTSAAKVTQFTKAIAGYFPAISADKLQVGYCGIRPKLSLPGTPAQDFVIQQGNDIAMPGLYQLFGIESPGLTASLAIGEYLSGIVCDYLG